MYLTEPVIGVPKQVAGKGRRAVLPRVMSDEKPIEARALAALPETPWTRIEVRNTERGKLNDEFSARRVWTYEPGQSSARAEWLVLRRDVADKIYYALSNAPADATLEHVAWSKCQRVFIECANRDAKTELGWDELRAQRYPAWEHQLALTCLAQWFVTETRLDWQTRFKRNADLGKELGIPAEELPPLSLANVRELLRAVLPLPQLTLERATDLVIEHLLNRTSVETTTHLSDLCSRIKSCVIRDGRRRRCYADCNQNLPLQEILAAAGALWRVMQKAGTSEKAKCVEQDVILFHTQGRCF